MMTKIGIIGGSIAALSAAIELKRKGFSVTIFERTKETFESRGAGIVLNKTIFEQTIKPGFLSPDFPFLDIVSRSIYTKESSYTNQKKPLILNYHFPVVAIHWGHLYSVLRSQFQSDYHAGEQVTDISQDETTVYLKTNQGTYPFDYVIGADGVSSLLRSFMFPHLHPTSAGYTAWRGICEDQHLNAEIADGVAVYFLYNGGHIVLYKIPAADYETTHRSVVNWVLYEYDPNVSMDESFVDKHGKPCTFSIPPNMLSQKQIEHVYDLARRHFPTGCAKIVCASQTVFAQAIYDLQAPTHIQGRCMLLGDAATILRPHASSGTLKALEGAIALAEALSASDEKRAISLATWNDVQVQKANDLIQLARNFGAAFVTSSTDWKAMDESSTMPIWQKLMGRLSKGNDDLVQHSLNWSDILDDVDIQQLEKEARSLSLTVPSLLLGLFQCLLHLLDLSEQVSVDVPEVPVNVSQYLGDYLKQYQQIELSEIKFSYHKCNESYVTPTRLQCLFQCYRYLIRVWHHQCAVALRELDYIPPEQRAMIEHRAQFTPYHGKRSLSEALWESLQNNSKHIAIKDRDNQVTYEQLFRSASNIAAALSKKSIPQGSGIALCMNKSWKCIAAVLGVLFSGHYYIPLDKRNPKDRQGYIISNADIEYTITDEQVNEEGVLYIDDLLQETDVLTSAETDPHDMAYIIYTSGTTGKPKGVAIHQKNVMSLFDSCASWLTFKNTDSWIWFHSLAFDFSVWELFGALLHGARVAIVDEQTSANMNVFENYLCNEHVSMLSLTPTALKNLLHIKSRVACKPRYIFLGGEAFTPDLLELWKQHGNTDSQLINMYGITEITVHATFHPIQLHDETISIGQGLRDTGLQILGRHQQELPLGFIGELAISGEGLSSGYWKMDDYSAKKFVTIRGQKRYLSGDLACLDPNGLFYYHGRIDKQFKLNGHRLEKEDIVGAILQVPGVQQVELKIVQSDSGIQSLCAYYLAPHPIADKTMIYQLTTLLPSYALPSYYVCLERFPLTVNGKIDVNSLPEPELTISGNESIGTLLQQCWEKALQKEVRVLLEHTFFELGGTSLKSVLLCESISRIFDPIRFTLVDLFRNPSFAQQEQLIKQRLQDVR